MKNWSVQAGLGVVLIASVAVAASLAGCSDDSDGATTTATGGSGGSSGGMGGNANGGQSAGGNAQGGAPAEPACTAPAVAPSAGECALEGGVLPAAFECNPITNEGCSPSEACDLAGMTGFSCYPGNTADLCEACDQQAMNGPFCTEGTTCFSPDAPDGFGSLGTCARYCCDDGDCGGATCVKTFSGAPWFMQAPNIGVCLE